MNVTTGNATYKTTSFDEAIDKIQDERRERQDIQIPLKAFSLSLDANGDNIVGTINGQDFIPTMHCIKQMGTIMGVSHAVIRQYLNPVTKTKVKDGEKFDVVRYERDSIDRELLVKLFKNGIRDGRVDPNKEFKFRTYTDGTLRAMLSDIYGYIDNVWYIENLRKIFKTVGGDEPGFIHWRGNADTIYANLLIPDSLRQEGDSDYGSMLGVGNCEIGKRRLSLTASLFRGLCTNGLIFGLEVLDKISQVHRGEIDLNKVYNDLVGGVTMGVPQIESQIDSFLEMRQRELDVPVTHMIAQIAQDYNLTSGGKGQAVQVVQQFNKHEKANRNLFGIVNSITRVAQEVDPVEHVRLEQVGGSLMEFDATGWDAYNKRASAMKDAKRNKIFGRVAA